MSSDPTLRDLRQLLYLKTGEEFTDEQLQIFEELLRRRVGLGALDGGGIHALQRSRRDAHSRRRAGHLQRLWLRGPGAGTDS